MISKFDLPNIVKKSTDNNQRATDFFKLEKLRN